MRVCVCLYVYIYVCVCIYVFMYACMYVCMYVCIYVCMYVCMYVYMYVCVGVKDMKECIISHSFPFPIFKDQRVHLGRRLLEIVSQA